MRARVFGHVKATRKHVDEIDPEYENGRKRREEYDIHPSLLHKHKMSAKLLSLLLYFRERWLPSNGQTSKLIEIKFENLNSKKRPIG